MDLEKETGRMEANPLPRALTDQEIDAVAGGGGRTVASLNHITGSFSPSGNPHASSGPGYFINVLNEGGAQAVSAEVHAEQLS
jgi:hypothetical protein